MLTKNEIKLINSLKNRSSRDDSGLFVVEGTKMVGELLDSNLAIKRLFVTEHSHLRHPSAEIISSKEMERISTLKTPSDELALVHIAHKRFSVEDRGLVLALDKIQDPGNMGTIIRISDWFGIKKIIASHDTVDCYNPKVVQSTMGALFRVDVIYGDLPEMLSEYRKQGMPVYGTMLEGGENIYDSELKSDAIVVMGNEGNGISDSVAELLDKRLFIKPYPYPVKGKGCESLNVAVATAIVCSEFRRREK